MSIDVIIVIIKYLIIEQIFVEDVTFSFIVTLSMVKLNLACFQIM